MRLLLGGGLRGGSAGLWTLRAVLRPSATAFVHTEAVKGAAHNMIAHTRKVLHAATAHQHNGVLLEVVAFAADIGDHFVTIRQPDLRHFAQSRVWLLGRAGHHLEAHTTPLRT